MTESFSGPVPARRVTHRICQKPDRSKGCYRGGSKARAGGYRGAGFSAKEQKRSVSDLLEAIHGNNEGRQRRSSHEAPWEEHDEAHHCHMTFLGEKVKAATLTRIVALDEHHPPQISKEALFVSVRSQHRKGEADQAHGGAAGRRTHPIPAGGQTVWKAITEISSSVVSRDFSQKAIRIWT